MRQALLRLTLDEPRAGGGAPTPVQSVDASHCAPTDHRHFVQNTVFHQPRRRLAVGNPGGYFPYAEALPSERKTVGAGKSTLAQRKQVVTGIELNIQGTQNRLREKEAERARFPPEAPGWVRANESVNQLTQSLDGKRLELEEAEKALEQEVSRTPAPAPTEMLWHAAAHQDFKHRNFEQELVDVRKLNYFIKDNQGQLVENVYLPDVEPNRRSKPTFLAGEHGPEGDGRGGRADPARDFTLTAYNPTFHRPVRTSALDWLGLGRIPLSSQAAYLEQRQREERQARPVRFLLRRRPDVGGGIKAGGGVVWTSMRDLHEHAPHPDHEPQPARLEAMLTARRGFMPTAPLGAQYPYTFAHPQMQPPRDRRLIGDVSSAQDIGRLDPELLPSTEPDDTYLSRLEAQVERKTPRTNLEGRFLPPERLDSGANETRPTVYDQREVKLTAMGMDTETDKVAHALTICHPPAQAGAASPVSKYLPYFHAEHRGKTSGASPRRFAASLREKEHDQRDENSVVNGAAEIDSSWNEHPSTVRQARLAESVV